MEAKETLGLDFESKQAKAILRARAITTPPPQATQNTPYTLAIANQFEKHKNAEGNPDPSSTLATLTKLSTCTIL